MCTARNGKPRKFLRRERPRAKQRGRISAAAQGHHQPRGVGGNMGVKDRAQKAAEKIM